MLTRLREGWAGLMASPGGAVRVSRGLAAGAAAAMLPAFGLHLLFAAGFAWVLRGSLAAAAATCLALGNPLTHAVLLPMEYAIGRLLLPAGLEFLPEHGPRWLMAGLPAAEETLAGGLVLAIAAGLLAWFAARRGLRRQAMAAEEPPRVIHLNGAVNSGKSATGRALAALIPGAAFIEGDDHDLPGTLPPEQRWAGALTRIVGLIAGTTAPCLVIAYPLDETAYRRLRTACVTRGAALAVVTLAPPLEVALQPRGNRLLSEAERARIAEMYAEGYAARSFSDLTLDNTGQTPDQTARAILEALARNGPAPLTD